MEGLLMLEELGLKPIPGKSLYHKKGYLAASDKERLDDLHEAFIDDSIRGVFCARGGYGTARIAPMLNYDMIRLHPKVFWGYSDITYLHGAIQKYCGFITFHGPMLSSDLSEEKFHGATYSSFFQLFKEKPIIYDQSVSPLQVYNHGEGWGRLAGGNLTLMTDSIGTPFEIDTTNVILLIEETHELTYRVDAMLTHLKQAGKFNRVQGVILGDFQAEKQERQRIENLLIDFFKNTQFPVVSGFLIGHCRPNYGVPLGAIAHLGTYPPCLSIESGVQS